MGDRTYTSIRFSGKITQALAEELVEALKGQGCRCDDPDTGQLTVEQLTTSAFYDSECNYSQMEGVEDLCREHGIAYKKTWEQGGGYDSGIMIFDGSEEHEVGTVDGEPALTFNQIKQLGTGFLAFFDLFRKFDQQHGALVIVQEDEPCS